MFEYFKRKIAQYHADRYEECRDNIKAIITRPHLIGYKNVKLNQHLRLVIEVFAYNNKIRNKHTVHHIWEGSVEGKEKFIYVCCKRVAGLPILFETFIEAYETMIGELNRDTVREIRTFVKLSPNKLNQLTLIGRGKAPRDMTKDKNKAKE